MANEYDTAFAEALADIKSGDDPTGQNLPSYMVAADTLNIANRNQSFFEDVGDVIEDIPNFISASLISGANSLYNIPASLGNTFGGEYEITKTEDVIADMDSDLSVFYEENKELVDIAGFIASSLIPGTAGVKILKLGQRGLQGAINSGKIGSGMGRALGLLAPNKKSQLSEAIGEVINSNSPHSLLNSGTLKAIRGGYTQNLLEGLAFETAVAATMHDSPILESMDAGDLVANIAFGAGIFGIVGGTIDAVKINSAIKKAVIKADVDARPWADIAEIDPELAGKGTASNAASAATSGEKIVLDFEQLSKIPDVPKEGLSPERTQFLNSLATKTRESIGNRLRTEMGEITAKDQPLAQAVYDAFKGVDAMDQFGTFIGAKSITRLSSKSTDSVLYNRLAKKAAKGSATTDEIDKFVDLEVGYLKLFGEDAGELMGDAPIATRFADILKKSEKVVVKGNKVTAGKNKKYTFNTLYNSPGTKTATGRQPKSWNLLKSNPLEVQARILWAQRLPKFVPTEANRLRIHQFDIPLLEKAAIELTEKNSKFLDIVNSKGVVTYRGDVRELLPTIKARAANKLLGVRSKANEAFSQEEIAAMINVRSLWLSGEQRSVGNFDDIFAYQSDAITYTKDQISKGLRKESDGLVDIANIPQYARIDYDTSGFENLTNHVVENMVILKQKQKIYQDNLDRATRFVIGDKFWSQLPDISSGNVYGQANRAGAGGGFASAASSNYGTLAATTEFAGSVTSRAINEAKRVAKEALDPHITKGAVDTQGAIEFATINNTLRKLQENYVLTPDGTGLEPLKIAKWREATRKAAEEGYPAPPSPTLLQADSPLLIPIETETARNLAKVHIGLNGKRTESQALIAAAQGDDFLRDSSVFYPTPINPKEFEFFATVTDESITGIGRTTMLYARTGQELEQQIARTSQIPHLKVRTGPDATAHFKSIGQWDADKALTDNYVDIAMKRNGVSAPYYVPTDPGKIMNELLNWHMERETALIRRAVSAKYEVQFAELERLGAQYTNASTSKFSTFSLAKFAKDAVNNPYEEFIKTALAVKKNAEYPGWYSAGRTLDKAFSGMYAKIASAVETAKSEDELLAVNEMLEKAGYKGAAYDASMDIFANATVDNTALTRIIQKGNSVLAAITLRLDTINAVNNAVSANVLLGAETKAVIRAIQAGDEEAIGELAKLTQIAIPGTDQTMFSASKLIANSMRKYGSNTPESKKLLDFYDSLGVTTTISRQYADTLENLTYVGNDATGWGARIDAAQKALAKAADKGERWTGNTLAEEFNRFVAADVMKQMTDIAVKRKLMTAKEQMAYINTFVNRTQGNYLAAQRPIMFQGPIGQAIGLFQTYQFNLMQQLLRHVGEGHSKDAMTLLGLQGTIHGMNGLPGFNAVNTHIIGNASGNTNHRDLYDTTYGVAGKEAGDWLMYGLGSNALGLLHPDLKINLYTRGDINPRHLTIVPTDPSQVPIVQATGRVFSNIFETAKKLGQGGDTAGILLQGLEHNGISRPLSGLAKALEGFNNPMGQSFSTSSKGNVVAANDLLTLANLGRILGAKPMDEAIALDATFRINAYKMVDRKRRAVLGESIKSTMLAGKEPTQEQIEEFAEKYAKIGGRQEEFVKWMGQLYKSANLSQSNKIAQSLNSPFSQSMQRLMGGNELKDFTE